MDGDAGDAGSPRAGGPLRRLLAGLVLPVAALGLAVGGLLVHVPPGITATAWVTAALIAAWAVCGAATSWAPERTPQWQQAAGAVLGAVAFGADRLNTRFTAEAAHGPHHLAVAVGMVAAALTVAVSVPRLTPPAGSDAVRTHWPRLLCAGPPYLCPSSGRCLLAHRAAP